jgi:hypothetical protein
MKSVMAPLKVERGDTRKAGDKRADPRVPGIALAGATLLVFASFSLLPRVRNSAALSGSVLGAAAILGIILLLLRFHAERAGRALTYEVVARRVHYVQFMMQGSIYVYWGWYWREVYRYAPLIVAQILFVYALDMMICWWRRDRWILGLGPLPIVLSTNFFLWFRDDWFFLQFLMLAVIVVGKEFITWRRDGRRAHIFNPSAFGLFVFSICLIVGHATELTKGAEIAFTFSYPPHIYLAIFLVGLVVQGLFSVTLVTLSAVAALYGLNLVYTHLTGSYQFVDSNIPVLVFLGAHLLVTDPATSPRSTIGRIIFGGLYGVGVFAMRGVLAGLGVPTFYDKLLCVPALNLGVQAFDRAGAILGTRLRRFRVTVPWRPGSANYAHMALWIVLFTGLMLTGFLRETRGDGDPESLRRACFQQRGNICADWLSALGSRCERGAGAACLVLGRVLQDGRAVPADPVSATQNFRRACSLGLTDGCIEQRAPTPDD